MNGPAPTEASFITVVSTSAFVSLLGGVLALGLPQMFEIVVALDLRRRW